MSELIDRERLKEVLKRNFGETGGADVLRQLIDAQPTVDTVKHAHWEISEYEYLDCSNCGESYYSGAVERLKRGEVYDYCPNCGAKMDEIAGCIKDETGIELELR